MLPDKIKITSELIQTIVSKRNDLGLTAYQLSEKLNKNKSWIPNIENMRTKNINKEESILLFSYLLNTSNDETEKYLEVFIRENEDDKQDKYVDYKYLYKELLEKYEMSKEYNKQLEEDNRSLIRSLKILASENIQ